MVLTWESVRIFVFYFQSSEKTTIVNQNVITYYFSRYNRSQIHIETFVNIM